MGKRDLQPKEKVWTWLMREVSRESVRDSGREERILREDEEEEDGRGREDGRKRNQDGVKKLSPSEAVMRKLSPSGSSSSGECGQLSGKERGSSSPDTDSGCEMSVMVTYAREPRVRRPDTDSDTADTDTVDTDTVDTLSRSSDSDGTAAESGGSSGLGSSDSDSVVRQNILSCSRSGVLRSTSSSASGSTSSSSRGTSRAGGQLRRGEDRPKSVQVTTIEEPPVLSVRRAGPAHTLDCPYSRAGIYSLEGSRISCLTEERSGSQQGQSDSGRGSSMLSGEENSNQQPNGQNGGLRSY